MGPSPGSLTKQETKQQPIVLHVQKIDYNILKNSFIIINLVYSAGVYMFKVSPGKTRAMC